MAQANETDDSSIAIEESRLENREDTLLLKLSGKLDLFAADGLEQKLIHAAQHARHVIVDLSGVPYLSSSGLRVFIGLHKQLEARAGSLRLAALQPPVEHVFRLAPMFALYPDVSAAMEATDRGGAA